MTPGQTEIMLNDGEGPTVQIKTEKGFTLTIDDKDSSINIITPGGNSLHFEDDKTITLTNSQDITLGLEDGAIKMGKNKKQHLAIGDEVKDILTELHTQLVAWAGGVQAPPIGTTSPNPDPGLTKWLQSLSKILSKY